MNKEKLQQIFTGTFNADSWQEVLRDIFGVKNLYQIPIEIILTGKELAENAFELGFFDTTDERRIGLYRVNLAPNVRIEQNKVGVRNMLRSIYKYDVDGALVVFVQGEKWRFSYISEIRVLNDDGTIETKATEPKRFTYLFGVGEKTKTPVSRFSLLANKKISLDDLRNAFSIEALNKEFYEKVSQQFYKLVGATTTKGKKSETQERIMSLPNLSENNSANRTLYQEFAVRLIGRIVFCWFLKVKKSNNERSLLPENLLSSEAVRQNSNYYHAILEPVFFQTLNTKINNRIKDLPIGCEDIPFLNGGLFEPQLEDYYEFNLHSNSSNHINTLKIPDNWFTELFEKLEQYNFTIDENSPNDVEISIDPENARTDF